MAPPASRRAVWVTLGLLSLYAALSVVYTWPLARHLSSQMPGRSRDLLVALWDMWWFERVLADGHHPLHTPYLFHPEGVSLVYHSISWTAAAMAWPLRQLWGDLAGYNFTVLSQTVLCAASMYALAKFLVRDTAAAWLAGFVFAFAPLRLERAMEHLNLSGTMFVPLVFLGLLRAWRGGGARWAWAAALALALVLLTGAHQFIMTCIGLALLAAGEAFRSRALADRRFWKASGAFAGAALVLVVPLLVPFVRSESALDAALQSVPPGLTSDLAGLVVPSRHHTLLGDVFAPVNRLFHPARGTLAYLGLVPLALLAAAACSRSTRREALPWLGGFLALAALSLGPRLLLLGETLDAWLPYRLVAGWAPLRALREPVRLHLIAQLFLAAGCAWGLVSLKRRYPARRGLVPAVCLVAMLDYLVIPFPSTSPSRSRFYDDLAAAGGKGALLELPLGRQHDKFAMRAQTVHGRPLVGGMTARTPPAAMRTIESSPLLRALRGDRPLALACREVPLREELERLRRIDVEYIVIRRRYISHRQMAKYRTYFRGVPRFADGHLEAHAVEDLLGGRLPCDPE